jgi:acetylornithine/succinyldiaminopimelate/putrescine aminotransferase
MNQPLTKQLEGMKLPLFPTYSSGAEAMDAAIRQLPSAHRSDICSALFGYHNTLLAHLQRTLDERQSDEEE